MDCVTVMVSPKSNPLFHNIRVKQIMSVSEMNWASTSFDWYCASKGPLPTPAKVFDHSRTTFIIVRSIDPQN